MSKMIAWLEDEVSGRKLPYIIIGGALLGIILNVAVVLIANHFGLHISDDNIEDRSSLPFFLRIPVEIFRGLEEETEFRLPLFLVAMFYRERIIYALLISSILFGMVHGNFSTVTTHGVGGMILGIIFLKFGGMSTTGPRGVWKGLFASTATHVCANFGFSILEIL